MEALVPAIAVPAIFFSFAWVAKVFLDHRARMRIAQLQSDLHMKLLDRFSTSQEITAYLGSASAGKFLDVSAAEGSFSYSKVLGAMIDGLVLASTGIGLLLSKGAFANPDDIQGLTVFGTLLTSLGGGFLLAAVATFVLAKSWGLINGQSGQSESSR